MEVVSLADQIVCVEREIGFRERMYPRWIREAKITQKVADLELVRLRAVLATLQAVSGVGIDQSVTVLPMPDVEVVRRDERRRVLALVQKRNTSVYLRLLPIVERELGPV